MKAEGRMQKAEVGTQRAEGGDSRSAVRVERLIERHLVSVSRLLATAIGPARALTIAEIQEQAAIASRREVELLLEHAWDRFPFVLVSGAEGIWQPSEPEQIDRFLDAQRGRAVKDFLKARRTLRKALAHGWEREGRHFVKPPVQMGLFEIKAEGRREKAEGRPAVSEVNSVGER